MPEAIPTVRTARLTLRAFRHADLDAYAAMCADAQVMRHIGDGQTVDRAAAWRQMAVFNGQWSLKGCGMWAVEHTQAGVLVGRVGLYGPPHWPALELGWLLGRDAWGQGLAREAALAAKHWALDVLGCAQLISLIQPGNERSVRVAVALGARPDGWLALSGQQVQVFRHAGAS